MESGSLYDMILYNGDQNMRGISKRYSDDVIKQKDLTFW